MKCLLETTVAGLVALAIGAGFPRATLADEPPQGAAKRSSITPGVAALAQNLIDTVLEQHIDPPARQQMILTGIKEVYKTVGQPAPDGLSRRVSLITTPEQFATLLADVWPAASDKTVTARKLDEALLTGLLSSVSGNPQLLPEKERKVQEQSEGNRYVGIHIALGIDGTEKRPVISEVFEGGPADRAGVKENDLIEQIEGVDTKGMELREAVDRLRGDEGTDVTIKVRQPGAKTVRQYTITRGQNPRQTVTGWHKLAAGKWDYRMSAGDPIAYIKISEMAGSTPHELRMLATQLEREGIRAIVLDLRGLWSTSVHCALLMADSLLDHGPIGRVRTSHGETVYQADGDAIFRRRPVVVLVDGNTSGAPEWLAAAIQDNKRGTVVGAPTASAGSSRGRRLSHPHFGLRPATGRSP